VLNCTKPERIAFAAKCQSFPKSCHPATTSRHIRTFSAAINI